MKHSASDLSLKKIELEHFGTTTLHKDSIDDFIDMVPNFVEKYRFIFTGANKQNAVVQMIKKRHTYTLNATDGAWLNEILSKFGPNETPLSFPRFVQILRRKYTAEEFSRILKDSIMKTK